MLRQQRIGAATQLEGGEEIRFEDAAPLVLAVVQRRTGQVAAGVVDQDVQATVVGRPIEDLVALFLVGDVGGERHRRVLRAGEFVLEVGACLLQQGAVARHHQHLRAEAQQFAADREADPGAGTGHQRALSVQSPAGRCHARLHASCRA